MAENWDLPGFCAGVEGSVVEVESMLEVESVVQDVEGSVVAVPATVADTFAATPRGTGPRQAGTSLAHPGRATSKDALRDNDVLLTIEEIILRFRW